MPDQGFLPLYRKFFKSAIWELDKNKPFHKREAWLDLLQMAQYKDGPKLENYQSIELKKGQVLTSILKLSKRWKWSRVKVRSFLNFLESIEENIYVENKHQKGRPFTVITLLNYSYYHEYNFKKDTETNTQKTLNKHSIDTYNKENKVNKEDKSLISHIFKHWNSKPTLTTHRELTKVRESAIRSKLKIYTSEEIKQAIDNYYLISKNPVCFYYAWPLENFLKQGNSFDKFLEANFNIKNHFDFSVKKQVDDGDKQAEIDKRNTLQKIKGMQ